LYTLTPSPGIGNDLVSCLRNVFTNRTKEVIL
jgi:hypothetical protein